MADVFISYSRKDQAFVERLHGALKDRGRAAWVDWKGIRPTEEFMQAIYPAIEAADTFVFVITPDSAASVVCGSEIAHAAKHSKRMIPIVVREVNPRQLPEALAKLNWIFCRDADDFERAVDLLIVALDTDFAWVRDHTRLLTRAIEWDAKAQNPSLVLRGDDLRAAERWLTAAGAAKELQPTSLQTAYIIASRKAAARRQQITLAAVSVSLVVAIVLAVLAWSQRNQARRQAQIANAGRLAGYGLSAVRDDLPLALLLSTEANRSVDVAETRNALLVALQSSPGLSTFLHGHHGEVTALAFSPDGQILASGSSDETVRLWDSKSHRQLGAPLPRFTARAADSPNEVRCLRFSADGASLAVGTMDGDFSLWEVSSHEPRGRSISLGGTINRIAFSPDGRTLAISSVVNFALLDGATGQRIGEPILGLGAVWSPQLGAGTPECVAFSPDGKTLAFDIREELWLWDVATRQPLGKLAGHSSWIAQIAFSPDGREVVSGDRAGEIRRWDIGRREAIGEPMAGRHATVLNLSFSADGKFLLGAGSDGSVQRYDLARSRALGPPMLAGEVSSVAVNPGGKQFVAGARDGTIRIWGAEATPALGEKISDRGAWGLAFSHDGALLAVAGEVTEIFDARTHQTLGTLDYWNGVRSLAFVGAGRVLALGCEDGTVRLWNAETRQPIGEPLKGHQAGSYIWSIASSPDGKMLATGGSDGTLRLWDPQARTQLGEPLKGPAGSVYCVAFNAQGTVLAAGGEDRVVRWWDVGTRKLLGAPRLGQGAAVWSLAFDPRRKILSTGDDNGTLLFWDLVSGRRLGEPVPGYASRITSLGFSPDGTILVAAGSGGKLQFIDPDSYQPIGRKILTEGPYDSVDAVTYRPDGSQFASALNNPPGLLVLDGSPASWQTRAAFRANRNLSSGEWTRFFGAEPYRRTFADLPPGEGAPDDAPGKRK